MAARSPPLAQVAQWTRLRRWGAVERTPHEPRRGRLIGRMRLTCQTQVGSGLKEWACNKAKISSNALYHRSKCLKPNVNFINIKQRSYYAFQVAVLTPSV